MEAKRESNDKLTLTLKEQYQLHRRKRRKKTKIKQQIICTSVIAITCIALLIYSLPPITSSSSFSSSHINYKSSYSSLTDSFLPSDNNIDSLSASEGSRILLQDTSTMMMESTEWTDSEESYPEGYPPDALSEKGRRNGGWILYFIGMCYTFVAIALVCDEWFVPAIEIIVERMDMTPDAAGATWMAAGGSAPELFTSLIGTFISRSNVGFGTIVGSAVFNVLFVIGCCAIFTPGHLPLTWWPFARDCIYYICSLIVLALFYGVITPDIIVWWEAVILLLLYIGYALIMFNNQKIHRWFFTKVLKKGPQIKPEENTDDNNGDGRTEDVAKTEKDDVEMMPTQDPEFTDRHSTQKQMEYQHNAPSAGVHFHASIYDFLTKDSTVKDLMGVHIVARIKGECRETFDEIDVDGNGHIDRDELKRVLYNLGEVVTEQQVTDCFDEIDDDKNGEISFEEFERWYLSSKMRITTDVKKIFYQFDDNGDGHIDCDELRTLLEAMNDDDKSISDEDVQRAMKELGKSALTDKVSEQEFIDWYSNTTYFEKKKLKRQATVSTVEEDEENGIEIEFPQSTFGRIMFIITAPIMYTLYYTLPDVQKNEKKHLWPLTFIGSMVWLMFYSYLMVWWATRIGEAWGVPPEVMGLTFLAAGTSVPDLLSSVIVAKLGEGDMAVSSSIGSNIFDILIGLPFPWLLFCIILGDGQIPVGSDSLFLSVIILIVMLLAVLIIIKINKWRLTHTLGWSMFVLWILFVAQDLIRQFCESCNVHF